MTEWQAAALVLAKRTTVLVSPRQCGKSTALALLALHRAFARPEQVILIVSASDEAAKRLLGLAAATASRSRLLSGSVVDESASKIVLSNGSVILSVLRLSGNNGQRDRSERTSRLPRRRGRGMRIRMVEPQTRSAPERIRTSDLSLRRRALYPLSYGR